MATDSEVTDAVTRVRKQNDMSKRVLANLDDKGIVMRSRQHYDDIDFLLAHLDALTARCEAAEGAIRIAVEREMCSGCDCESEGPKACERVIAIIDAARRGEGV